MLSGCAEPFLAAAQRLKRRVRSSGCMQPVVADPVTATLSRKPVPRGIALTGPAILSYGFRPFFLLAGAFAVVTMTGWIAALAQGLEIGGTYGALNWHAHEMLFGYTSAALAGFMLTAIPNWTGRLPVSGVPLLGLVLLWLVERVAMAVPDVIGVVPSILLDASFLPVLSIIAAREIVAGKNWKNLKILTGLVGLSLADAFFHFSAVSTGQVMEASRVAVGIYVVLISIVGGRIVPSFTRNWLVKAGSRHLPKPFSRFDLISIVVLVAACAAWAIIDETLLAASLAFGASSLHAVRLWRWAGWLTLEEPLLLVLHLGYAFIPLGLFCVGLAELGFLSSASALHVLTVGAIGIMTIAIMTRTSLGHSGRPLTASLGTSVVYLSLLVAATVRPFAELLPQSYHLLLEIAGAGWIVAFALYLFEYGPILCQRSRRPEHRVALPVPKS